MKHKLTKRHMLIAIREMESRLVTYSSEIQSLRSSLAHQVKKNDDLENRLRQAWCLAEAGGGIHTRWSPTSAESAMQKMFVMIAIVTREENQGVTVGPTNYKAEAPPCHQLPHEQWCDSKGPGGFMGHTCYPKEGSR